MTVYEKREFSSNKVALYEGINRRFLKDFKEPTITTIKSAKETCDLHINSDQPLQFISPKGEGLNEAFWDEPRDLQLFWSQYEALAWGLIAFVSVLFLIALYYWWGF